MISAIVIVCIFLISFRMADIIANEIVPIAFEVAPKIRAWVIDLLQFMKTVCF